MDWQNEAGRTPAGPARGSADPRPDVDAALMAAAARMAGAVPNASGASGTSGAPGVKPGFPAGREPGVTARDSFDPDFGLAGLHPDDHLDMLVAKDGQDLPLKTRQVVASRVLGHLLAQDPALTARIMGILRAGMEPAAPGGPGGPGKARGQAGEPRPVRPALLGDVSQARMLIGGDPLFDQVYPLVVGYVNGQPAVFKGFIREQINGNPEHFASVYAEQRRKLSSLRRSAGKPARRGAPVLEDAGGGRTVEGVAEARKAKVMELTRKFKQNRGTPEDFARILDLTGVLERLGR